jgi:hypothetical protein
MTFIFYFFKIPKNIPNFMFQIFVLNQKNLMKGTNVTFLKLFLNAMIKNIKIHNIFNLIEISKYMEPNKCTH